MLLLPNHQSRLEVRAARHGPQPRSLVPNGQVSGDVQISMGQRVEGGEAEGSPDLREGFRFHAGDERAPECPSAAAGWSF